MKWYELALIGGAAYLFFARGSPASAESGFGGGFAASASTPLATTPKLVLSGQNVPGTTIPMSTGFAAKVAAIPTSQVEQATTADLGKITVTQAPTVTVRSSGGSSTSSPQISAAAKAEVTQIFQKEYISGNFVPSSVLAGKMTKTDIIIAQNIAKKSFA